MIEPHWWNHPIVLVGVGSAVGGICRYCVGRWFEPHWLWATFAVNIVGSFVLAFVGILVLERMPAHYHALFLLWGTGFCGGFTTFSTLEWELFRLVRHQEYVTAALYVFGSIIVGFVAVLAGVAAAIGIAGPP